MLSVTQSLERTENRPLLSIVVPTRNRNVYARSAIKSLTRIKSALLEVVIEDNSDDDGLHMWIRENVPDNRIVYHYSSLRTSQSGNYDRSMRGVTGEYVAFIGDDDGVNPEILPATEWAKRKGYDVVVPLNSAHYFWPDLKVANRTSLAPGELRLTPVTGEIIEPDPKEELKKCARDAGQQFHMLPRAYYGIVRRELFDAIKLKSGSFFPGVSPDLAAAAALGTVARRVCVVDYPLFLPASSARSNAGLSGLNRHVGSLQEQEHLGSDWLREWSPIVPPFYSVQTIWAEAFVTSLRRMGRKDLLREFNVAKLYAWLLMFYPRFLSHILPQFRSAVREAGQRLPAASTSLLWNFVCLGFTRAKFLTQRSFGLRPTSSFSSHKGIETIEEAVVRLQVEIRSNGFAFTKDGVTHEA